MRRSASTRRRIPTLGDYKKLLKTLGCERAVLVQPSVYGADNAAMLDALEARSARASAPSR